MSGRFAICSICTEISEEYHRAQTPAARKHWKNRKEAHFNDVMFGNVTIAMISFCVFSLHFGVMCFIEFMVLKHHICCASAGSNLSCSVSLPHSALWTIWRWSVSSNWWNGVFWELPCPLLPARQIHLRGMENQSEWHVNSLPEIKHLALSDRVWLRELLTDRQNCTGQ